MEKIFVHKNETAHEILETIIATDDLEVTIVIPRNAGIKDSVSNFHFLKKESVRAEKRLSVESVDEEVLALAKASKLPAIHPLFAERGAGRSLSDIIPIRKGMKNMFSRRKKKGIPLEVDTEDDDESMGVPRLHRGISWQKKVLVAFVVVLLLVAGVGIAMTTVFARAEIIIRFKKIPWNYVGTLLARTASLNVSSQAFSVPAQLFHETKTLTQFFPASSRAETSIKATGKITIYNAYSSEPQTLVATTRFVTPDGLIFRLVNTVIVPAAQIKDGKIVPSSIKTAVAADKSGPTYNLSPVARLSIPGLKGTPKYDGFYGALEEGSTGGFIGEKAIPTAQDIADAKTRTTDILRATFENNFLETRPEGFLIIDGASDFRMTKLTVNPVTNAEGKFSVLGEAEFRTLAIREEDVRALLLARAQGEYPDKKFESLSLTYTSAEPDFDTKELTVILNAEGTLTSVFDPEKFRRDILGLEEQKAGSVIRELPDLTQGKVVLWPAWLKRVPKNEDHVKVIVQ